MGQEISKEIISESSIGLNKMTIVTQKPILKKKEMKKETRLLKDPGLYLIGQCTNPKCKMNQVFCDLDIAISLGIGEFFINPNDKAKCPTCFTDLKSNFGVLKFYDCKYEVSAQSLEGDKCTLSSTLKPN